MTTEEAKKYQAKREKSPITLEDAYKVSYMFISLNSCFKVDAQDTDTVYQ